MRGAAISTNLAAMSPSVPLVTVGRDAAARGAEGGHYEPPPGGLFDPGVLDDPYPYYAWLRRHAPCARDERAGIWLLSRHDDVRWAASTHALFSSAEGAGAAGAHRPMMSMVDPPAHGRLRRLVARHFLPKESERWAAAAEGPARAFAARLRDGEATCAVSDFAAPVSAAVMLDLLGLAPRRVERFSHWTYHAMQDLAFASNHAAVSAESRAARQELVAFLVEGYDDARRRRDEVAGRVVGSLLEAEAEGGLTRREAIWFLMLFMIAGYDTLVNAAGNLALLLTREPRWLSLVVGDPSLAPAVVEESLRFDPPIQGFFRTTVGPARRGEIDLPAGARVLLLFASANRDEAAFEAPDEARLGRRRADAMSFGAGAHYCIGAHVAVHGLAAALRALAAPGFALRARGHERTANILVRGLRRLAVAAVPAGAAPP